MDLEGLTLGVLGLGKLGTRTAKIAQAFGMKVIAWSQNLTPEKCKEAGVDYVSKEDLFRQADFITIHRHPVPAHARPRWRQGTRADEAFGLHHQYLARPHHRRGGAAGGVAREQDRGRRARRVRRRAAADRSSAAQDGQCRAHAASRLRSDRRTIALISPAWSTTSGRSSTASPCGCCNNLEFISVARSRGARRAALAG